MANNPIIYDTLNLPVSSLNISLSGEVLGSVSGLVCSPSGGLLNFIEASGITFWSYDFVLLSDYTEFSIYAIDIFGNESEKAYLDITYQIPEPIIYNDFITTDTLDVKISGEAFGDIDGFAYFPEGGIFTSGSVSGNIFWDYSFTILSPNTQFSIQSFDINNTTSNLVYADITYQLPPPVILSPGIPKILSDSISTSSSTSDTFVTLNGNFKKDGVLVGDQVLSLNGKNISLIQEIVEVQDTSIKFNSFLYPFEENDEIKIYKKEDRPDFNSNKLNLNFSGKVSKNAKKIVYSSGSYTKPRFYSSINSIISITSGFNTLNFVIDGEDELIQFPINTQISVDDIVNIINSYYSKEVAFIEASTFYIEGFFLEIKDSSGNNTFGFSKGSWTLAHIIYIENNIRLDAFDSNILNIVLDSLNISLQIPQQAIITPTDLSSLINSSANSTVSFTGPSKVIILGNDLININSTLSKLGIIPFVVGSAIYTNDEFNFNFKFNQPNTQVTLYVIDYFYRLSIESSSLFLNYKINAPTLLTDNLKVTQDSVRLSGEYDKEGVGVLINSDVVGLNGIWNYDFLNLFEGLNDISISTQDIFGSFSDELNFTITFTDPNNLPLDITPGSGSELEWSSSFFTILDPKELEGIIQSITDFFDYIIPPLENARSILKLVRAFIVDFVDNPIALFKRAVQTLIDNILDLIDSIFNGAGLYFLNTIPTDPRDTLDFLNRVRGGFDGMIDTIIRSLEDPLDPNRPRLGDSASVGGYVIAISDTGGVNNFFNALSGIVKIFRNEIFDRGIGYPLNLKASGENGRVTLTWQSPGGLAPMNWLVYRSKFPNGEQQFDEREVKNEKGEISKVKIPKLDANGEPIYKWGTPIGYVRDWQVWDEFKFIDGKISSREAKEKEKWYETIDRYLNNTSDFINGLSDTILVSSESSKGDFPVNGTTYYYKVVGTYDSEVNFMNPNKTITTGQSYIVSATPSNPDLVFVEEFFNITNSLGYPKNKTTYQLSGAIYNRDNGEFSENFSDINVTIDNKSKSEISSWIPNKGIITIKTEPTGIVQVQYWTIKLPNLTRAKLTSSVREPSFVIKNDSSNILKIQVGRVSGILNNLGDTARGRSLTATSNALKNIQTVKFKDFSKGENSFTLTIDQIMETIRSQVSGVKVFKNKSNQVVIVDNQNPDIYQGSYLKIHQTNSVLGFTEGQDSSAGPTSGISPDWERLALSDLFPLLKDTFNYIENVLQQISRGLESASNALIDFIDLLIQKVESLLSVISRLEQLLIELVQSLNLGLGVYILEIPNNLGGNNYLKNCLLNSKQRPLGDYAAGIMFLYTDGGTKRAIDLLFSVD
jgi:hypothetical protein